MSALTLKDLTLATPPKIVPDFVDELVQPDKLAQLRALYLNFSNSGTSAPEIASSLNKLILKIPHI